MNIDLKRKEWDLDEAITLAREVEKFCPAYGCHVALTGGCLYKPGLRKDCDILFYSIRGEEINFEGLFDALKVALGIRINEVHGFLPRLALARRISISSFRRMISLETTATTMDLAFLPLNQSTKSKMI